MAGMANRYTPTDDEFAAALAAVELFLHDKVDDQPSTQPAIWRASQLLAAQSGPPRSAGLRPTWGNVERLNDAGWSPFTGITGL